MRTLTRIAVGATGVALTVGTLAFTPATAQNIEAGGIEIWGATTANYSQVGGPYRAFATYGATDNFAIGLDNKLVALPGTRAGLAVPSNPALPAGDIAGTTVRSVSVGHVQGAWAVTADGAVRKWGGARGIVIPDNTWTPAQLGGEAVEVSGGGSSAKVRLQGGGAVAIDSLGISPCTDGGQPLTGVQKVTGTAGLLQDGRVVKLEGACAVTTVIAASETDPVIDLSATYATTASGRVLRLVAGAPEVSNFPTGFAGKAVRAVAGSEASAHSAILTDQDQIVVWRHGDGNAVEEAFQVPSKLDGRAIISLEATETGFAVLYADVANQAKPTVSGTARVDSELTATEGDWLGEPTSLDYQWLAVDGETETVIEDATDLTFTPTADQLGKALKVRVTATRGDQEVSETSDATSVVQDVAQPLAVTTPASASGTAQVGQTLTGTPAEFSDAEAAVTNQWLAGSDEIGGATGTTLVLTAAQVGKNITFKSTATRDEETLSSTSAAVGPVTPAPAAQSTTAVSAAAGTYGTAGTVTVRVSNGAGRPVAGTVSLAGAGAAQTAAVAGGVATFQLDRALAAGAYTLTASYSGSSDLTASSGALGLTVNKTKGGKPAFKVNKASTSKKKGKATVTVGAGSGLAKATGKATVTLKKGKTTKKIVVKLSNGKRSISLPKLKKGTWKVQVSYNGDSNYIAQKSKSYNLKIKK